MYAFKNVKHVICREVRLAIYPPPPPDMSDTIAMARNNDEKICEPMETFYKQLAHSQ